MNAPKHRQRARRRDPSWEARRLARSFEFRLHLALRKCGDMGRLTNGITLREVARRLHVLGIEAHVVMVGPE